MAKVVGRCRSRLRSRGGRFLVLEKRGSGWVMVDHTVEFTGHEPKRRKKTTRKKHKSKSNFGRKRSGPLRGFASRKQKKAALRNLRKGRRRR